MQDSLIVWYCHNWHHLFASQCVKRQGRQGTDGSILISVVTLAAYIYYQYTDYYIFPSLTEAQKQYSQKQHPQKQHSQKQHSQKHYSSDTDNMWATIINF